MAVSFHSVIPILRIYDVRKAREFYQGFLGFSVDWEQRIGSISPVYQQISRAGLTIHLSERFVDGSPGVHLRVKMSGIINYHKELLSKTYRYMEPVILDTGQGALEMGVMDPFGNRIVFVEEEKFDRFSDTDEGGQTDQSM